MATNKELAKEIILLTDSTITNDPEKLERLAEALCFLFPDDNIKALHETVVLSISLTGKK